jgi:hypothetical protein
VSYDVGRLEMIANTVDRNYDGPETHFPVIDKSVGRT